MFKKTILLAGTTYFLQTHKTVFNSPQPKVSMLLRGEYENKIRRFSPPQKIFDVFATIYEKGRLYMTLKDLLKAICFYNYSLSEQKDAEGFKPKYILQFLGKQDKFQIYDYFILVRFLAFQRQKIIDYFQNNNIEAINQIQLRKFLRDVVCKDYFDYIKKSLIIQSRQFKPTIQDYDQKIDKIVSQVFDHFKKESFNIRDIIKFRKQMISELYQFEFLMFPITNNQIDGVDFARSIVKYVQPNKTRKFMQRIKTMQGLENINIGKQSYIGFHLYMQTNITELQNVLNKKGAISTKQFTQLINKYVDKKYHIKQKQLQIITKLLDYDQSGFLQKREILGVLKNLQYYTTVKSGQLTFIESIKSDWEKVVDKCKRIKQIIDE